MNNVTMIGRLTKDPELVDRNGTAVCDLRVAENGARDDDNPVFIDVAAFGKQGEACARVLTKGRLVGLSGSLRYSEWEAEDGSKRSRHSIVAQRVEFLDPKPDAEATEPSPEATSPEATSPEEPSF